MVSPLQRAERLAANFRKANPSFTVGTVFNTEFEIGCVVTGAIDTFGNFTALDSSNVECQFHIGMVKLN